jgi:hypothetical protein
VKAAVLIFCIAAAFAVSAAVGAVQIGTGNRAPQPVIVRTLSAHSEHVASGASQQDGRTAVLAKVESARLSAYVHSPFTRRQR